MVSNSLKMGHKILHYPMSPGGREQKGMRSVAREQGKQCGASSVGLQAHLSCLGQALRDMWKAFKDFWLTAQPRETLRSLTWALKQGCGSGG